MFCVACFTQSSDSHLDQTYVTLPNGYIVSIVGVGCISLTNSITLFNALYIPEFKFNLLSVSILTKTLNSEVSFTANDCFIQDLTQPLMIGQGSQVGNLYFLEVNNNHRTLSFRGMSYVSSVVDSITWHKRLGHPSMSKVATLSKVLNLSNSKINKDHSDACHVCHLSKQKHIPFKPRHNMSKNAFDLLHIDTWGPFSESTVDGSKYFLTIVDDFSRATWVFLMCAKSDVINIFPDFVKMVANQYDVNVKAVRSDIANELRFTEFYAARGIVSYHSCPETPEQNSVVERKHQHILNVARALLFQSNVPLIFWGDCILTTVFLINRLPSPVLDNKSPFEKLTNKQPYYESLKTFGCLCYVSTSTKNRHKFDPRAKACVFLGYHSGYKGYKLLDIETHSVSISRHVLFHEDIFPFALSSLNDNVKSFFPHVPLPVVPDVVFSKPTSSDAHLSHDVSRFLFPLEVDLLDTRNNPQLAGFSLL